jgi:acyl-CoA dehydrogenase
VSIFAARADEVAQIAARHSDDVDREGRFPQETVQALKDARLLSIMIPRDCGGDAASLDEIAEICTGLGQHCASSAMIFAMHQIKMASLVIHGADSDWHRAFMRRIVDEQLLLASSTTEAGIGGDLRNSICGIEPLENGTFRLVKDASVISYGAYADAILATARQEPDAPSSNQVLVVLTKDQYTLRRTANWDTLGMRGTCSEGFILTAEAPVEQILPKPFAEIAAQSMLATSHLLWSSLWYGIANNAVSRAQNYVRAEARKRQNVPPGALRLAEAVNMLQLMKSTTVEGLRRFAQAQETANELGSMGFAVAMNNVKVAASKLALDTINLAMLVCGIMGYKNDTPYSLGRHWRDAMSAQLMISNDRIFGNTSNLLLVHRLDPHLLS